MGADCLRYDADSGSWRCELAPAADDGYCFVDITRWHRGRVDASISHCEREITSAVNDAYTKRTGLGNVRATCMEDDGTWTCDLGPAAGNDRCTVAIERRGRGLVSARISYCERTLAVAVNRAVGRAYTKRTGIGNVTAECALDDASAAGGQRWTCDMGPAADHDRCLVAIEMRDIGPRVIYWATTCKSGRL